METFKKVSFSLLVIFFVIVAVGFLLPREMHLSRSQIMKADKSFIFNQVNVIQNWNNWSPWFRKNISRFATYHGQMGMDAGFTWTDTTRKNFHGMLAIDYSKPQDSIHFQIELGGSLTLNSGMAFKALGDSCQLEWKTVLVMNKNPFLRYMDYFIRRRIGKAMSESLIQLDSVALQEMKLHPPLKIEQTMQPSIHYYYLPRKARYSDMQVVLAHTFPQLRQMVSEEAAKVAGPPFVLYHPVDSVSAALEVGIPVISQKTPRPPLMAGNSAEGLVLKASYQGPYTGLPGVYASMRKVAAASNLNLERDMWESYLTNPEAEPDSTHWKTEVWFRLKK